MSRTNIQGQRIGPQTVTNRPGDDMSLVCELLTLLENTSTPGFVNAFLGRMATGYGFKVAAAYFCEDATLQSAKLRVVVGGELAHWANTPIPDALATALRLRNDRPVALKARRNGRLSFDKTLPQFRGRNWSGVALPLLADRQIIGAIIFGGPELQLQSRLQESVLVRLTRALARAITQVHQEFNGPLTTAHPNTALRPASKGLNPLLARVFANLDNAIVIADLNRQIVAMNPVAEQITGWQEHEAIGKPLEFVVQMITDPYNQNQRPHPGPHAMRWLLVQKDGSKQPVEGGIVPLTDANGIESGFIANLKDDRHNRHVERALIRAKEEQRFLVERLPIGVLILQGTNIASANPAWRDFLQVPMNAALVGQSIHGLLHPEDQAFVLARNRSAERTVGPLPPGEFRFRRGDGTYATIEIFKAQMVEFEGMLSTMVVGLDVSETRIMQAQLETSERMASIGTLAAGVAHEINNPLTYVVTNLDQLHHQVKQLQFLLPKQQQTLLNNHLKEAKDGASRVCEIVRDLKKLSKGDDDTILAVDIIEVVNAAANMASNEIRHRANLERAFEDVPLIAANPRRLAQVFINLLVNAAQAMESGHADEHTVGVKVLNGENNTVIVEIWDDGPGMSPELQDRIFEPFFTTKSDTGGLGLGLMICHNIVDDMGGTIHIYSEIGKGTCFTMTFPAMAERKPSPEAVTKPPPVAPKQVKALQLLVVDDEPLVARALQRILRNHNVDVAHHGAEALKLCLTNQYDAIFCDVMMPQMNGLQFLTMLQEVHPQLAPKLVFMSGGVFDSDVANHIREVSNPMIEKPFVPGQITEVVHLATTSRAQTP